MADMATPSAASLVTGDPIPAAGKAKQQFVKPEKPDEEIYKKDLEKAEKEHSIAQEKLVRDLSSLIYLVSRFWNYLDLTKQFRTCCV